MVAALRWPHEIVIYRDEYKSVRNWYSSAIDEVQIAGYIG